MFNKKEIQIVGRKLKERERERERDTQNDCVNQANLKSSCIHHVFVNQFLLKKKKPQKLRDEKKTRK